jgi:hypothetical protein
MLGADVGLDFQNSHQPEDEADGVVDELATDIAAGLASTAPANSPVVNKQTAAETSRFFATTKSSLTRAPAPTSLPNADCKAVI